MADEQYEWLDSDAAERLLRGEPLDAIDADARARAARIAEALAALAGPPPIPEVELPGEKAALAAFRAAQANGAETAPARAASVRVADAGVVRLGEPGRGGRRVRWVRPVRFGMAAAVAAAMVGGVAVAAGTGVLPTPFDHEPGPATSVSVAETPERLTSTPTPGDTETELPAPPPDEKSGDPEKNGSSPAEAREDATATGQPQGGSPDDAAQDRTRAWWTAVRSSCRDIADGRELGADRRRDLEDAAGSSGRIRAFCKGVLNGGDDRGGTGGNQGRGNGHNGNQQGRGNENDQGDQDGNGGDGDSHQRPGRGGVGGRTDTSSDTHTLDPVTPSESETGRPSPAYSAVARPAGAASALADRRTTTR
ncbi:hypothetical protein NGF19_26140 [Streptomyces sp. RY43-2]|uniref:Extensin n=1 Tax=Streptomyces macrolidinus TaxID=2952607 RepID=A0ABT0ZKY4_9ACTN|nr:hypothetical protein [Streptomyces macrolidinus]MCN9244221.1 hypothetical protein [Streptomyces macrolidinus]